VWEQLAASHVASHSRLAAAAPHRRLAATPRRRQHAPLPLLAPASSSWSCCCHDLLPSPQEATRWRPQGQPQQEDQAVACEHPSSSRDAVEDGLHQMNASLPGLLLLQLLQLSRQDDEHESGTAGSCPR